MSIRFGSFFAKSNLLLRKWLHLIVCWCREDLVAKALVELDLSRRTVIDCYNSLRQVCSTKLFNEVVQLGGPGRVVQIDESLFNHKQKYHRGRVADHQI